MKKFPERHAYKIEIIKIIRNNHSVQITKIMLKNDFLYEN